jgi:hypothetical protein
MSRVRLPIAELSSVSLRADHATIEEDVVPDAVAVEPAQRAQLAAIVVSRWGYSACSCTQSSANSPTTRSSSRLVESAVSSAVILINWPPSRQSSSS